MLAAVDQTPATGSKSSALASGSSMVRVWFKPPATSTFPPGNSVAVWPLRATAILPVGDQVLLIGSYISAELVSVLSVRAIPPANRTLPSGNSVVLYPLPRASPGLAAADHAAATGS